MEENLAAALDALEQVVRAAPDRRKRASTWLARTAKRDAPRPLTPSCEQFSGGTPRCTWAGLRSAMCWWIWAVRPTPARHSDEHTCRTRLPAGSPRPMRSSAGADGGGGTAASRHPRRGCESCRGPVRPRRDYRGAAQAPGRAPAAPCGPSDGALTARTPRHGTNASRGRPTGRRGGGGPPRPAGRAGEPPVLDHARDDQWPHAASRGRAGRLPGSRTPLSGRAVGAFVDRPCAQDPRPQIGMRAGLPRMHRA